MRTTLRQVKAFAEAVGLSVRKDKYGNVFLVQYSEHLTRIDMNTDDVVDAVCAYAGGHSDYVVASLEFEGKS